MLHLDDVSVPFTVMAPGRPSQKRFLTCGAGRPSYDPEVIYELTLYGSEASVRWAFNRYENVTYRGRSHDLAAALRSPLERSLIDRTDAFAVLLGGLPVGTYAVERIRAASGDVLREIEAIRCLNVNASQLPDSASW